VSERVAALIVAAGAGTRFGGALPKVFVPLGGLPLLAWSLRAFGAHPAVDFVAVVVSPEYLQHARELCAAELALPHAVVAGGPERRLSVHNGLRSLSDFQPDLVAIHDGARPLVSAQIISDSLVVAREHGAALATVGVVDTVKQVDASRRIVATLDRNQLQLAQTPQTFRYDLIARAHEQAEAEGWEVTDDAMLLERLGHPVYVSAGHWRNLKVTTPEDLWLAEALLGNDQPAQRLGHGFDLHRLVPGRRLVLGGVEIPYDRGLLGHSDADAALHAICDAILGATGLGDIGRHFPDTDPAYKDADSLKLTRRVAALAREAGWRVGNVDVTIIAQAPRLAPHVTAMREATAGALGVPPALVNFKATTTEKLGPIGKGEAIAAEAVALLLPLSGP
jgi:2-C-methyl-D-erythritol 4-phosphate cytidylyltransferase/2-C-methyl-D-erythritol 2,4-cyclodiphosphate synthase